MSGESDARFRVGVGLCQSVEDDDIIPEQFTLDQALDNQALEGASVLEVLNRLDSRTFAGIGVGLEDHREGICPRFALLADKEGWEVTSGVGRRGRL